jgi:glycosyltransferase involved in cell wall biosynthesis
MDRPRVAVIIPALNEAATIGDVVVAASAVGHPIVVDDGSSDFTADVAKGAGATVVRHAVNTGYDGALNSGFAKAAALGCRYLVTMDADGQHDAATITPFIDALDRGASVVIGIRDRHQRVTESLFASVGRARWGIHDPLCGMKAYRVEVWEALGHFDSFGSIGTELAVFAASCGDPIVQLPVSTRDRAGRPRFGSLLRANAKILRALIIAVRRFPPTPAAARV